MRRATMILSGFLSGKGVRCNLDVTDQGNDVQSNTISIGSVRNERFKSRYVEFRSSYHNERRGVIGGGDVADHFEMRHREGAKMAKR